MPTFVINATGHDAQHVVADDWLHALGQAMTALGLLDGLEALACEILPNQTVVARNVKTGQGFVVMRAEGEGAPGPATVQEAGGSEPFGVQNLAQSVFQANLSYELRTPLNDILGVAGMLVEEAQDRQLPQMAEDLQRLGESASGLLGLIDAGLEANRLNTGEIYVQRLTFGVVELLEDAAAAFGAEAGRRGNRVVVAKGAALGEMRADPSHLRAALIEMLRWSNERVQGGEILLEGAVENDAENTEWILLTVRDDGPALDEAEVGRLFQVMAGTSGPPGSAAATIRRSTARELCRRQGGDLALLGAPDRPRLRIRIERGR